MPSPSRFLMVFLVLYGAMALLVGVNALVIGNTREYGDLDRLIEEQGRVKGLYRGLAHSFFEFRQRSYARRRPEVTIIGTSRSQEVKSYFFTRPFYNLGGPVYSPFQAGVLADKILMAAPPKTLIYVLELAPFCGKTDELDRRAQEWHADGGYSNRYWLVTRLLMEGRISVAQVFDLATGRISAGDDLFGISAALTGSGFGPDGSIYNFVRLREMATMDVPARFTQLFGLTDPSWSERCHLSRVAMNGIDAFVAKMHAVGTEVVLMLAPYPSKTLEGAARQNDDLGYLDEMRRELATKYPHHFFDFTDLRPLGANDCEFLDSAHGGEVAYMRMVNAAARDPLSPLHEVVDRAYLERAIEANAGRTMVADDDIGRRRPAMMALAEKLRCSR